MRINELTLHGLRIKCCESLIKKKDLKSVIILFYCLTYLQPTGICNLKRDDRMKFESIFYNSILIGY